MKEKARYLTIALVISIFLAAFVFPQRYPNPRGQATLEGWQVSIEYGRPSTKGRDVMAMIAPGTYWRMGADANTTLTTQTDLRFGEQIVPEGSYVLLAHFVEGGNWQLVVCRGTENGFRPKDTLAIVPFQLATGQPEMDLLTIDLKENGDKSMLVVWWGTSRLSAEFSQESSSD